MFAGRGGGGGGQTQKKAHNKKRKGPPNGDPTPYKKDSHKEMEIKSICNNNV